MIPSPHRCLRPALVILAALTLAACDGAPPDPARTTDAFWRAIADSDRREVIAHAAVERRGEVRLSELPTIERHEIGRIVIEGDRAEIATSITTRDPEATTTITTYLERVDGAWRVDYDATTGQLKTRAELEEIVSRVRDIGETLSGELRRGVETLKESLPGIQEELKRELDRMETEIERQLPELKRRLEEFSRQLEEALKTPPPTESEEPPAAEDGQIAT